MRKMKHTHTARKLPEDVRGVKYRNGAAPALAPVISNKEQSERKYREIFTVEQQKLCPIKGKFSWKEKRDPDMKFHGIRPNPWLEAAAQVVGVYIRKLVV
jgi:hypothetical protein